MSKVFILYFIFSLVYIAVIYSSDFPEFKEGKVEGLKQPSVLDLSDNPSLYLINDYVNSVIFPAREYFAFEYRYNSNDSSFSSMMHLFFLAIPPIYIVKHLKTIYSTFQFILSLIIGALICVTTMYVISSIYDRYFRLNSFDQSEKDLRTDFSRHKETFPITEWMSFNNFVIDRYLCYYCVIDRKASRRRMFGKIFNGVLTAIYFIFFYTMPYS